MASGQVYTTRPVPRASRDRIEEHDSGLDLGRGHGHALDGGEFVTQLGHALLELVVAFIELGQALCIHVAAGFVATDGLQYALALLATPLLFGGELRQLLLERRRTLGVSLLQHLGQVH
jgi:hypothetical protein